MIILLEQFFFSYVHMEIIWCLHIHLLYLNVKRLFDINNYNIVFPQLYVIRDTIECLCLYSNRNCTLQRVRITIEGDDIRKKSIVCLLKTQSNVNEFQMS